MIRGNDVGMEKVHSLVAKKASPKGQQVDMCDEKWVALSSYDIKVFEYIVNEKLPPSTILVEILTHKASQEAMRTLRPAGLIDSQVISCFACMLTRREQVKKFGFRTCSKHFHLGRQRRFYTLHF